MIYCISEIRCILNVKVQNVGRIVPHNDLYNLFTKYIDGVRQNNVLTFQLLTPLYFANRDRQRNILISLNLHHSQPQVTSFTYSLVIFRSVNVSSSIYLRVDSMKNL
jgi:predicted ATP-dependent Lon-type protease